MSGRLFFKRFVVFVVFVFLLTDTISVFAADSLRAAKITELTGDVRVMKAGGEKTFSAFEGMSLSQGDRIITGIGASASVLLDDDKSITVAENSQISLSELQGSAAGQDDRTGLNLFVGKLWTSIKKALNIKAKFEVKTPTTVMGVRGTKFYVNSAEGQTGVLVLEGKVAAAAYRIEAKPGAEPGQIEFEIVLNPGEQTSIDESVKTPEDAKKQEVKQSDLELFVLQEILKNPEGINPALLQNIQQVIEQKTQEKKREEQEQLEEQKQQQQENNSQGPGIIQDPGQTTNNQTSSSSPANNSPNGSVTLSLYPAISGNTFVFPAGGTSSIGFQVSPSDARLQVTSNSNAGVAKLDFDENASHECSAYAKVQALSAGTANITVTASGTGYSSASLTLTIRVVPVLRISPALLEEDYQYQSVTMEVYNDYNLWSSEDNLAYRVCSYYSVIEDSPQAGDINVASHSGYSFSFTPPSGLWQSYPLTYMAVVLKSGSVVGVAPFGAGYPRVPGVQSVCPFNPMQPDNTYYFNSGKSINIGVFFDTPVDISGTPKIKMNSGAGAYAYFNSAFGCNKFTQYAVFTYTVLDGENSSHLDYDSYVASIILDGASIKSSFTGEDANLTLPAQGYGSLGDMTDIVIDTAPPSVEDAVYASGADRLVITLYENNMNDSTDPLDPNYSASIRNPDNYLVFQGSPPAAGFPVSPIHPKSVSMDGTSVYLDFYDPDTQTSTLNAFAGTMGDRGIVTLSSSMADKASNKIAGRNHDGNGNIVLTYIHP